MSAIEQEQWQNGFSLPLGYWGSDILSLLKDLMEWQDKLWSDGPTRTSEQAK